MAFFSSSASASDSTPALPQSFGSDFIECLDKVLEWLAKTPPEIPPGPHPIPFLLGCEIPGCAAGSVGPIDLRIDLRGDVIKSATLEFDGLPPNTDLDFSGPGENSKTHPGRFLIRKGEERLLFGRNIARISGLPPANIDGKQSSMTFSGTLTDPRSSITPPSGKISLFFDRAALEQLDTEARRTNTPNGKKLSIVEMTMTQSRGKTIMARQKVRYHIAWCLRPPKDPLAPRPFDKIVLLENKATDAGFSQEAVVLANGRVPVIGELPVARWIVPKAMKFTNTFHMLENMLMNDGTCSQLAWNGTSEPCAPEISTFSQDRGMKLVTPITDWTDRIGDKAQVEVKGANSMLKVPIHFYIAWEHSAVPCSERRKDFPCPANPPSTQSLGETWLTEARTIFDSMQSGITFDTPGITTKASNPALDEASCQNRDLLYSHFDIKPEEKPTGLRVFFVQLSKETDINGFPVYANGWACDIPPPGADSDHYDIHRYNDILISTSIANSTTLAHELGHALSLQDLNDAQGDITEPLEWANDIGRCIPPASPEEPGYFEPACRYLMWSGSPTRSLLTKGQGFRGNINQLSAVERHKLATRPLEDLPSRLCMDSKETVTCPAILLDAN